LPVVCESDERLQDHNADQGGMDQVFGELARGDVVAELQPSSPTTT